MTYVLPEGKTRTPEFLARNPLGKVPVLELPTGEALFESGAILCHLAEGTPFLPPPGLDRARVHAMAVLRAGGSGEAAGRGAVLDRRRQASRRRRRRRSPGWHAAGNKVLGILDARLAAREFLARDRFTIADIANFPYVAMSPEGGFDLGRYPNVAAWVERVRRQPGHVPLIEERPQRRSPSMPVALDRDALAAAILGGLVLSAGGSGMARAERNRRIGEQALDYGPLAMVGLDELPDEAGIIVATGVGAPGYAKAVTSLRDSVQSARMLIAATGGAMPAGVMPGHVPGLMAWMQAAVLGIPLVDAATNGRGHPTVKMGGMGLASRPEVAVTQAGCGGAADDRVEITVTGSMAKTSTIMRAASVQNGGSLYATRGPFTAAFVRKGGAPGAMGFAARLGRAMLDAAPGQARVEAAAGRARRRGARDRPGGEQRRALRRRLRPRHRGRRRRTAAASPCTSTTSIWRRTAAASASGPSRT